MKNYTICTTEGKELFSKPSIKETISTCKHLKRGKYLLKAYVNNSLIDTFEIFTKTVKI